MSFFESLRAILVVQPFEYISLDNFHIPMSISTIEIQPTLAERISIDNESLMIDLVDGRNISVPLEWYPRLLHGTPQERNNWRLIGRGEGIHWSDLDEDISVENVWAGRPSGESQRSLKRWLEARNKV